MTDSRKAFAARFNQALDDIDVPPKQKGRQLAVSKMFGVSQEAARKWLEGESAPRSARLEEICARLNVMPNWLLSGHGPRSLSDRSIQEESPEYYSHRYILKIMPRNYSEQQVDEVALALSTFQQDIRRGSLKAVKVAKIINELYAPE